MPRAEPRAYGSLSVRSFICVCVRNAYLSNHLQLSAEINNTSRSRYSTSGYATGTHTITGYDTGYHGINYKFP